jgi:hypothetical protein
VLCSGVGLFLAAVQPAGQEVKRSTFSLIRDTYKLVVQDRHLVRLMFNLIVIRIFIQATQYLNQEHYTHSGIPLQLFGVAIAIGTVASILAASAAHRIETTLGANRAVRAGGVALGLALAGLGAVQQAWMSWIGFALLWGVAAIQSPILFTHMNRRIPSVQRASTLSVGSLAGSLLAILMNPVLGVVADYSLAGVFFIMASMCLGVTVSLPRLDEG